MTMPDSRIGGYGIPLKVERCSIFLTIAMAAHGIALLNPFSSIEPTRKALLLVGVCLLNYLTPFAASLFLVLRHRTVTELAIAYFSLICSIVWLVLGADVIGVRL